MNKQLQMFAIPTEVTQDNLLEWRAEIGEKHPLGQFLYLLHCHLPDGFIELLNYRDGSFEAEIAADSIEKFQTWLEELAAYNMAQLESEN